MIRSALSRIVKMDPPEILWRGRAAARKALDRARAAAVGMRWDRRDLVRFLAPLPELGAARASLANGRWHDAHRELARHVVDAPQRFAIAPSVRSALATRIHAEFPDASSHAAARADRILAGNFDLLGYKALRFDSGAPTLDWHYDPVNAARPPMRFWSAVPYLDPSCGDHKIIWELNRHQHWLTLGRAYWLTNDPKYRDAYTAQLASWLEANAPLTGINWASMLELAFRSLSWMWTLNFFADPDAHDSSPWIVDLLMALDRQLAQIERNLSYYFSPNTHLLGEALALYVAGRTLPALAASPRREAVGRRVLVAEIERQITSDGGHCERSTHYHRYTLDFYLLALDIARITGDPTAATFEAAAARLGAAARLLADDRGRLPQIGDDDAGSLLPICGRQADDIRDSLATAAALTGRTELGAGQTPEEALWMLAHPSLADALERSCSPQVQAAVPSGSLPETGYYVSRSPAGDHLVIDGGPHGYHNGGHAHADALSLTLTVRGVPLLIDTGTACYTTDPERRNRFRSTALHNTVLVDHRSQSIPSGPFHWAHTASTDVHRWRVNGRFDYFDAAHDGYRPLAHRRRVLALHGDLLIVSDLIDGTGEHAVAAHWHVDPRWRVDVRGRRAELSSDERRLELMVLMVPHCLMETFTADETQGLGWHAPLYGRVEPATTIRVTSRGHPPLWMVSVFGLDADNPIEDVETVPVWAEAGALVESHAVRISRHASTDYFLAAEPADHIAATWRIAELETDARMLFCRVNGEGHFMQVALVDGSRVRSSGHRRLQVALPRPVPDLHLDLAGSTASLRPSTLKAQLSRLNLQGTTHCEELSCSQPRVDRGRLE
jgi:hypothetical protein